MNPLNVVEVRTDVEGQRRLFDTRFSVRPEPETELAATGRANRLGAGQHRTADRRACIGTEECSA